LGTIRLPVAANFAFCVELIAVCVAGTLL